MSTLKTLLGMLSISALLGAVLYGLAEWWFGPLSEREHEKK